MACSVATAVMAQIGPNDPLTQVYLDMEVSTMPEVWGTPGWSEGRMNWLGTVKNCITRHIPDRPAGIGQSARSSSAAPAQLKSAWGPAPPPAPRVKHAPQSTPQYHH